MKKQWGAYLALIILLIICAVSSADFLSVTNLGNIARQVSYSGIIALGMTLVIAAGGIDLSVGSLMALSSVVAFKLITAWQLPPGVELMAAVGVAILCGAVGGVLNGALVVMWRIPPFIVTLGTMSIFRSVALYLADAGVIQKQNIYFHCLSGQTPFIVMCVLTVILGFVLRQTPFGRHVCAVGSNEKVAIYAAIRTGLVKFYTYVIIGGLCGVSAILYSGRMTLSNSANDGTAYELDAIAAVIIGGTSMSGGRGTVWGTLAGVFILGIISNILTFWGISSNLQGLIRGLVIIVAVLFQYKKGVER